MKAQATGMPPVFRFRRRRARPRVPALAAWVALAFPLSGCGASSSPATSDRGSGAAAGSDASSRPLGPDGSLAADGAAQPFADDAGSAALDAAAPIEGAAPVAGDATDAAAPYKGVANSACADLVRLGVSWYYNWTLSPVSCTSSQFAPMIWGHTGKEQTSAGIKSEVDGLAGAGYRTVLGFNEPDNASQSNMSATNAISLWPSLASNASIQVGSPATQANTTGQAWFTAFMQKVNADTTGQLRVDFIAAHWYGWNAGSCDAKAAGLESYIEWLEAIPSNRQIGRAHV